MSKKITQFRSKDKTMAPITLRAIFELGASRSAKHNVEIVDRVVTPVVPANNCNCNKN